MEFDKSKVYSAVNADKIKFKDLIIPALNINELERKVESEMGIQTHEDILSNETSGCFGVDSYGELKNRRYYPLAYLVKSFRENYKPFSSIEKARETIIEKHGGWVAHVKYKFEMLTIAINSWGVLFGNSPNIVYYNDLLSDYVFANDGTPCGELV